MPVITISRQHGAGAGEIVRKLARTKGIEVASKKEIEDNLRGVVGGFLAEKYTSETGPTFLDTIIYNMTLWRGLLSETVLTIAKGGNTIIYGRGGSIILTGIPGVVNILVVGERKKRIQYISQKKEVTMLEAEEIIDDIGKRRSGFFSHHFGVGWPDPGSFDLTLNPFSMGPDKCIEIVSSLMEMSSLSSDFSKKGRKLIEERYVEVSSENRVTLATDLDKNLFRVSVRRGKTINITFRDVPAPARKKAVSAVADFHKGFKVLQTEMGH